MCNGPCEWNGDKNEESPVLAESFRFLWPGCLLARGSRFSEPEIWIIFSRCKSFFCSSKPRFLPSAAQTLSQFRFPVPSCLPTNEICIKVDHLDKMINLNVQVFWVSFSIIFPASIFSNFTSIFQLLFPPPMFRYFSHLHFVFQFFRLEFPVSLLPLQFLRHLNLSRRQLGTWNN